MLRYILFGILLGSLVVGEGKCPQQTTENMEEGDEDFDLEDYDDYEDEDILDDDEDILEDDEDYEFDDYDYSNLKDLEHLEL